MNYEDFREGGKYTSNVPYPEKPKKPVLNTNYALNATEIRKHADLVDRYELEVEVYKKKKDSYHAGLADAEDRFKKDLFEDLGITNHPKAERLFSKAWERGHSSGMYEVYLVAQDLVDLIN
jgi:predicted nucleic acid-binding protein